MRIFKALNQQFFQRAPHRATFEHQGYPRTEPPGASTERFM
jgi:hypothetical protein